MKLNQKQIAVLCCALCAVMLIVALLLPLTMGKYGGLIDGYINFQAGSFNAAITQHEKVLVGEGSSAQSMFVEYSIYDFKPGMYSKELDPTLTDDTAATTKFRISNGTTESDAASTPLEYTIRIRVSHSLPLRYTLKSTMVPADGDTPAQVVYSYPVLDPTVANQDQVDAGLAEPRYEYPFVSEKPEEPVTPPPATGADPAPEPSPAVEGEGGEGGTGEGTEEEIIEVTFQLEQGKGENKLVWRDHELIAEWVADEEDATSNYMKEVEIVEILVTVVSVNKSDDPNYGVGTPHPGGYADGMIVVNPLSGATKHSQTYKIDLRSFKADEQDGSNEKSSFNLTLHNGYGMGLNTDILGSEYTMTLRMPADLARGYSVEQEDESIKTYTPWTFSVYRGDSGNLMPNAQNDPANITYFVRNLKTNEDSSTIYTTYEAALKWVEDKEKDDEKNEGMYEVYISYKLKLTNAILYYQKQDNAGVYQLAVDKHEYVFRADNIVADVYDDVAFLNKLEVVIDATYKPLPAPSVPTPDPGA